MSTTEELRARRAELVKEIREIDVQIVAACQHEWLWFPVAGEGQICRKCHARNYECED